MPRKSTKASTVLTIYTSRRTASTIEEKKDIILKKGNTDLGLNLPGQFNPGTFELYSEDLTLVAVQQDSRRTAPSNPFEALVGKSVKVYCGQIYVNGVLKLDADNKIWIDNTQINITDLTAITVKDEDFEVPTAKKAEDTNATLTVHAEQGGAQTLHTRYETTGLSIQPTTSAVYNSKDKVLTSLTISALVSNQTDLDLEGQVKMICGQISEDNTIRPMRALASARMGGSGDDGEIESVGEQKVFVFPNPVKLNSGANIQLGFSKVRNVPAIKEYFVPADRFQETEIPQSVSAQLRLVNDKAHNLGFPLPASRVVISENGSKTASGSIRNIAEGEEFTYSMGTTDDIKFQLKLASSEPEVTVKQEVMGTDNKDAPTFSIQKWVAIIENHSDEEAEVTLNQEFNRNFKPLSGNALQSNGATAGLIKTSIPAKDKKTVEYSVRVAD